MNYKAGKLQLHGGDGAKDAISHIKSTVAACPDTKIVLGGYSQGASVIDIVAGIPVGGITWGDPLPPQYATNIAAVATFGDVATRTGQALPTQSTLLGSKAIDLCNPADPICHAGPGNEWSGHTQGYVPGYTDQAAAFRCGQAAGWVQPAPARIWAAARLWPGSYWIWPGNYGVRPGLIDARSATGLRRGVAGAWPGGGRACLALDVPGIRVGRRGPLSGFNAADSGRRHR